MKRIFLILFTTFSFQVVSFCQNESSSADSVLHRWMVGLSLKTGSMDFGLDIFLGTTQKDIWIGTSINILLGMFSEERYSTYSGKELQSPTLLCIEYGKTFAGNWCQLSIAPRIGIVPYLQKITKATYHPYIYYSDFAPVKPAYWSEDLESKEILWSASIGTVLYFVIFPEKDEAVGINASIDYSKPGFLTRIGFTTAFVW